MKNLIFFFIFLSQAYSCSLAPPDRYEIDITGIKSRTECTIENLSISQYYRDNNSLDDIRPNNRNEVTRYCCSLNKNSKSSKEILFSNLNKNYKWSLCELDLSIVENDSLNALSIEEKLEYTKRRELLESRVKDSVTKGSLPFTIQKGFVYHVFGLCNIEGSYYFCLDSTNKLLVQYQDGGPW